MVHGDVAKRLGGVQTPVVGYIWTPCIARGWGQDTNVTRSRRQS